VGRRRQSVKPPSGLELISSERIDSWQKRRAQRSRPFSGPIAMVDRITYGQSFGAAQLIKRWLPTVVHPARTTGRRTAKPLVFLKVALICLHALWSMNARHRYVGTVSRCEETVDGLLRSQI